MKHFRFALCFAAAATVALLSMSLGRNAADPAPIERHQVAHTAAPESIRAVESTPEISGEPAPSPEERKQTPAPAALAPASAPAQGDDESRHPGDRLDAATIVRRHGNQPLTRNHPDVASVIKVQERNNRWLMAHPAVVGTAVGLNDQAEVAIIVYTKVDAPEIPKAIEGVPVAVLLSGEFTARLRTQEEATKVKDDGNGQAKGNSGKPSGGTATIDPKGKFRPSPIGVSTGHYRITAGTIGCRVKVGNTLYALSNNHVYADENTGEVGDNVLQPGRYDGGLNPEDKIGTLAEFEPIEFSTDASNTIDAAIALMDPDILGKSTPSNGYGTPKSALLDAALSLPVMKYGRTTVQTKASIAAINGTFNIGYDSGTARFVNQILISGRGFSAGGDSGSLIVCNKPATLELPEDADHRKPVGLLFAGSRFTTIANPIAPVLAKFGAEIDGE